ncbi:MAG: HslU--HslV peptidase ATPase subunit [Planctomycetota bacterium]|nr:MAG: HslU--HslV peptidase ATPase subunit [Planctomycetota bacterium]
MSADYTPAEIVAQLDKYIVGQTEAKKSIAISIRNRWRRLQIDKDLQKDIVPKNIIMIGPTGVGKTEIARRMAQLIKAPFIKVEATKYTEVGYHGRDVESMIRDLVKVSVDQVQKEYAEKHQEKSRVVAEDKILDILIPPTNDDPELEADLRDKFRKKLKNGELNDKEIEIQVEAPMAQPMFAAVNSMEDMGIDFQDILSKFSPGSNSQTKRVPVKEAIEILAKDATKQFIDDDAVTKEAIYRVENTGIIFIDEIDKVAGRNDSSNPDVSRGGVQRDLLPIVEGSSVTTRQGIVNTDHILFIAAGAFHSNKPSDLMPELQGRFPIRVELDSLSEEDYKKILEVPKNSLIKQYIAMLATEGIELSFDDEGIAEIASSTCKLNEQMQNIGARRLHTVLEKILHDISFSAPERKGESVLIDKETVINNLKDVVDNEDLSKYIL